MTIPVEASEIETFTPESLLPMGDAAPVFRIKAPSERCLRRVRTLCGDDGLETFSEGAFLAEKFRALKLHWPERGEEYATTLRGLLAKLDQGIELDPAEALWIDDLDDKLFEAHAPLRVMRRKVRDYQEYVPRHVLRVYLAGWSGLRTEPAFEAGILTEDCIVRMIREMERLGAKHSPDLPAKPFLDLYAAALSRINLDEDEEKNSPAPSPDSSSRDASTTAGETAAAGRSSGASEADATSSSSSTPETIPASG